MESLLFTEGKWAILCCVASIAINLAAIHVIIELFGYDQLVDQFNPEGITKRSSRETGLAIVHQRAVQPLPYGRHAFIEAHGYWWTLILLELPDIHGRNPAAGLVILFIKDRQQLESARTLMGSLHSLLLLVKKGKARFVIEAAHHSLSPGRLLMVLGNSYGTECYWVDKTLSKLCAEPFFKGIPYKISTSSGMFSINSHPLSDTTPCL